MSDDLTTAAPAWERWLLYALAAMAAVAGLAARLWIGRDLPLWVDESWTVMVATQPDWAGMWREAWRDANAPLYYALMALWTPVAGVSDVALRLPSLLCAGTAGLLPILWRAPGLTLGARLAWGAMIWLWVGGLGFAADARVYALLLLLATAQTIAFVRLLDSPDRRAALIWATLVSLAGLAHYFALFLTLAQGAFLLAALGPRVTLRLWPAGLAFVPLAGWLAIHPPRLLEFARPDVGWYVRLDAGTSLALTQYLVGPWAWPFLLLLAVVLGATWLLRGHREEGADTKPLVLAALAGVIAFALVLILGWLRPSVTARYLTPFVPAVLLGLILIARQARRAQLAYALLIAAYLLPLAELPAIRAELQARNAYSLAPASAWLAPARPERVALLWDHPNMAIVADESLRPVGSFFLNRAGVPAETDVMRVARDGDAATALSATPAAIFWLYDDGYRPGTAAAIGRLAASRPCRLFPRESGRGVLACAPLR
ncbi:hypothetical protein [Sphingosinicella sp.]|uniref:hypothetical protein n=1 Tax=Sphingosinicella sp. TaxID=1917971 RepID=UPI00403849DF